MAIVGNSQDFFNNEANQIITNSSLRHEEHIRYSQRLVEVARQRLNGVLDLEAAGLVQDLGGIGTTISMYERLSDTTQAEVNMDGAITPKNDRLLFDEVGVPVPFFGKYWQLNQRLLESSRGQNATGTRQPLSTVAIAQSTIIVAHALESALFNGLPNLIVNNNQMYGYLNHPDRRRERLQASWTATSGVDIIGDVQKMLDQLYFNNFFGEFILYVPKNYWSVIQGDFKANSDKTYKDRIEDFPDIREVKPADALPDNNVVMVQLTEDVVDMVRGVDLQNIQYPSTTPLTLNFLVYTVAAFRVKSTQKRQSGICHATPTLTRTSTTS